MKTCGQGIPGTHGVKSEVSVHQEVTDTSCSSGFPEALPSLPHSSCCSFSQLAALWGHFPELSRQEGRGGSTSGPSTGGELVAGLTITPSVNLGLEPSRPGAESWAIPGHWQGSTLGPGQESFSCRREETSIFAAHLFHGLRSRGAN